jgi:UDP-N-acetyl-2-amino-2-deoxyglucuronate dehydrogenase
VHGAVPVSAPLNVAIVGLGMAVAPHAQSLQDLRGRVEVTHAFSPSAQRRTAFASRFAFPVCESMETVLRDRNVDAVLVLTPPHTHLDIVRRCAAAGKHVLLEKPLATSSSDARALVEACRSAGVTLGVVLQHRFRSSAEQLRALLGAGELGEVLSCSTTIRLWRPQSYYDEPGRGTLARDGGGVLITQGIHTLDLMLSLVGPVAEARGYATTTPMHRMEGEDLVCAALRFTSGAFGSVMATTAAYPGFPERIELACTLGSATLSGTSLHVHWADGRQVDVQPQQDAGGTGADPMAFSHEPHRALIADFADAIATGRPPRVDGVQALRVQLLIDALIEAGRSGGPVAVAPA